MKANFENLQTIFSKMETSGFDFNQKHRWSFYFFHSDRLNLMNTFSELRDYDYSLEFLKKVKGGWKLKVSKLEVLGIEKLHRRNQAFNELATYCSVDLYDGWEVENYKT